MLPPTFISKDDNFPDFVCGKCNAKKSWQSVEEMQENIGVELSKMKKDDVNACQKFIDDQRQILHPNHFYNVDVKIALTQIIGQQEGGLPAVSDELLNEKITLCKNLEKLLQIVVPGENDSRWTFKQYQLLINDN